MPTPPTMPLELIPAEREEVAQYLKDYYAELTTLSSETEQIRDSLAHTRTLRLIIVGWLEGHERSDPARNVARLQLIVALRGGEGRPL